MKRGDSEETRSLSLYIFGEVFMDDLKNNTNESILHHIKHSWKLKDGYTFIITGKIGPTGKSWLKRALIAQGYRAIEITGSLYSLVEYTDNKNHFIVDEYEKTVLIVLNRRVGGR
jgi:hypothetical protein